MKCIVITFLALLICISTHSQSIESPYDFSLKKELPLTIGSIGLMTTGYILSKREHTITINQLNQLNRNDVWIIDRSATFNWSTKSANASHVFLYSSLMLPAFLLIPEHSRRDFGRVALSSFQVFTLNAGLTSLVKELSNRKRPFLYNANAPLDKKLDKDGTRSFFSGHTSVSASMTFFFAKTFSDYYPNSKFKPLVWSIAVTLPAMTGLLRYLAGKHYLTDILVGYTVGAGVGLLIPTIHKKKKTNEPIVNYRF